MVTAGTAHIWSNKDFKDFAIRLQHPNDEKISQFMPTNNARRNFSSKHYPWPGYLTMRATR
jgi:hypothetical protein